MRTFPSACRRADGALAQALARPKSHPPATKSFSCFTPLVNRCHYVRGDFEYHSSIQKKRNLAVQDSPNQSNQRTHPALSSAASVKALWHLLPIDRRDPAIANSILLDIGTAPERTVPPKSSSEPRTGDQPVPRDPSRKTVNKPVHLIFSNPAAASENGASEVVQSPSRADHVT